MSHDRAQLGSVARRFGQLVGIFDPLRLRLWTECGLTMSQLRLLLLMRDVPGITSSALAERFRVHPSTITGHIDKLLRRELVHRTEDGQDRRMQHNYLTDEGASLVGQIERVAGQHIIGLLERLSDDQVTRLSAAFDDLLQAAEAAGALEHFNTSAANRLESCAGTAEDGTMR